MSTCTEQVLLRVIAMPCCNHVMCWVNPRLPSYCPECGKFIIALLRPDVHGSIRFSSQATIKYEALE